MNNVKLTEKDKELVKQAEVLYIKQDIKSMIDLMLNWQEPSFASLIIIDKLSTEPSELISEEQKETLKSIRERNLQNDIVRNRYEDYSIKTSTSYKFKIYTHEDFINSTITVNDIDKTSKLWSDINEILTEYEEFCWLGYQWHVHIGDLDIESTFILETNLIVTGNLTIKGDYIDGCSESSLIVLGDMIADNIISEDPIYVKGNVIASGLILCYYNDYVGEFYGTVTAQLFCIDDRDFRFSSNVVGNFKAGAMCPLGNGDELNKKDVEPFIDEILNIEECDDGDIFVSFSGDLIKKYLKQGKSIYKQNPKQGI